MNLSKTFTPFANFVAHATGRPVTFLLCCALVVIWGATGPIFGFSDTWQLVINTSTTIVTFLMVFLIQNTQNRDNLAIQVKLDELIRAGSAPNRFIGVEHLTEEELEALVLECEVVAKARNATGAKGSRSLVERAARAELSSKHVRLAAARDAAAKRTAKRPSKTTVKRT
jgi:low affinity Fe/Cu permease